MDYEKEFWKAFNWFCPNCGKPVIGYKNKKESIKLSCEHCKIVMVRTIKGRRHDTIEIYVPRGQYRIG